MKEIFLTMGQVAKVSDADYEDLSRWKWCASKGTSVNGYYAVRSKVINGKRHIVSMHREILGLNPGDRMYGDHINGDTLDNRRENLRACTPTQNTINRKEAEAAPGKLKGAYYNGYCWYSLISYGRKTQYLGSFSTAEEAHAAYSAAAKRIHGEFLRAA